MKKGTKQSFNTKLVCAIMAFTRACVADSWKGGGHPDDIPEIEADLNLRRAQLNKLLSRVMENPDVH